ncbi:MAG: beta-galactosidase [bacterium]
MRNESGNRRPVETGSGGRRICVNYGGLEIDGALYPLYSGSVHYWRLETDVWETALDHVREMGFRFVCTYIPWSVHEVRRGTFDFGERTPEKDVGRFLETCRRKGFFVLVRPGPHINSELTYFGYPERIFAIPEALSRNPDGAPVLVPAPPRMFFAPGYASERFYEEVGLYFDALCPILRKHLYPRGPVVGVQADNELSFFFRTQPYDHDYSPPAVQLYRRFLEHKYGGISRLNRVYGSKHSGFDRVQPPTEYAAESLRDLPFHLDWMEFKEYYIIYGLNRISAMLKERGIEGVFTFHNYPTGNPVTPYNVVETEKYLDVQGCDLYCSRREYAKIKESALFLSTTSRMPFFPEFGSGVFPWWRPLFLDDQKFTTPAVFMNGAKAVNFYMIVERDRWYGSPVTRKGRMRDKYFEFYRDFLGFLHGYRFHEYRMFAEAVLLSCRDYERFQLASSLLNPVPSDFAGGMPPDWFSDPRALRGLRDPVQSVYQRQRRAYTLGFAQAGIPLAVADSTVDQEVLNRFRLVIAPSFEFMSMSLQRKLLIYVIKGGTLVLGPRVPIYDEFMEENSKLASHLAQPAGRLEEVDYKGIVLRSADTFADAAPFLQAGSDTIACVRTLEKGKFVQMGFLFPEYEGIERSPVLVSIMEKLAAAADLKRPYAPDDPLVETRLHVRGEDRMLFAANPTAEKRTPAVATSAGEGLLDVFSGERLGGEGAVGIPLEPFTVRVFKVERGGG